MWRSMWRALVDLWLFGVTLLRRLTGVAQKDASVTLIVLPGQPLEKSIVVQTRAGTNVPNVQSLEVAPQQAQTFADLRQQYASTPTRFRTEAPSGIYNCHGLTFASRRSQIEDISWVQRILDEDAYKEVARDETTSGDIVVYWVNGEAIHSGLVVSPPTAATLRMPTIVSKWGCGPEAMHLESHCEYMEPGVQVKFYRI